MNLAVSTDFDPYNAKFHGKNTWQDGKVWILIL